MTEGFSRIDQELCTGCGNCVSTCPSEAISGDRHKPHTVKEERCVACGRCVQVCNAYDTVFEERAIARAVRLEQRALPAGFVEPLFAAYDGCRMSEIKAALLDPKRVVLAQCGPAVCETVAEDFGLAPGTVSPGRVAAALKRVGFRKVYAFSLGAAIAVVEQAHELVHRLESGGILPVINSSCPAAVKFIEQFHPELLHYLAGCKSPHMITGALIKSHVAALLKLDPAQVYSVSIGPCTSRKFEVTRPELNTAGNRHVDAVLTARELVYLVKDAGIDILQIPEEPFDSEIPSVPGMENVYCTPGDVSKSVIRAGCELLALENGVEVRFADTETEGVRAASVQMGKFNVKAVAITGLTSAVPFFEAMKKGTHDISFMELLACPAGCVSGGGQPKVLLPQDKAGTYGERAKLYPIDSKSMASVTQNSTVGRIYRECFAKSAGDKSNRALQTEYQERKI